MKKLGTTLSDTWRFWMHFPVGLFTALSWYYVDGIGWMLFAGFLAYEFIQEWRKHDLSYKDVIGWLAGLFIGTGIIWLIAT